MITKCLTKILCNSTENGKFRHKMYPFCLDAVSKNNGNSESVTHQCVPVKKRIILGICSVRCTRYIYCTAENKENSMRCVLCVLCLIAGLLLITIKSKYYRMQIKTH